MSGRTPEQDAAFARKYGSVDRVDWINTLPCFICLILGERQLTPSQNAHTEGGGMGYKAHHSTICPLCDRHHKNYDQHQPPCDEEACRDAVKAYAKLVDVRWTEMQSST